MKITSADCRIAIDQYWPDFKHAYADLRKQQWKRDIKVKNEQGQWIRYFNAFEDQTPTYGYVETWLAVIETESGLVVRHLNDDDRAFLHTKYPWIK